MAFPSNILRCVLSFLAGTLFAFAFPRFNFSGLAWLAPALVLWLARNNSRGKTFWSGFLSGLGCWLIMVYWLLLIPFRLHGLAAYLGQSVVGAAYMGLWCWLCWYLWPARRPVQKAALAAGTLTPQWLALNSWD